MKAVIFTDGGSRGNPGKAAIGYVIKAEDGSTVYECGMNIGTATNNAAEYTAVLEALKAALGMGYDSVELYLDSQLVEKQIKGEYKVKSEDLMPLFSAVMKELRLFVSYTVTHVRREMNKRADKLVNEALDSEDTVINDMRTAEDNHLDGLSQALKKAGISCSAINEINGAAIIVMDIEESEKLRASYGALTEAAERCRIKKLFFEFEQEKRIV